MRDVLIGQTDYTVLVQVNSTTGAAVTGLAHTDIDIAYARVETDNDVTTADVAPADLANLVAAHSDWGWEEVSATDHPGLYRLDIADAVFATGAWEAVVTITDASGTDFNPIDIGFRLVAFNVQDGVRLGLTALPNAAADAAGGLPISDAGGLDLDAILAAINNGTYGLSAIETLVDALEAAVIAIEADTQDIQSRIPLTRIDGGIVAVGTAAAIASGSITLAGGHGIPTASSLVIGLTGGTNAKGKARLGTLSGDVLSVDPAWDAGGDTLPSGTITYVVGFAPAAPTSTPVPVNVTAMAANVMTAAAAAADLTTELQNGLATAAALATLSALVDDLEGRLTAARAGYLDNLSAGAAALQASVDDLEGRLSAARAGYLDNLSAGAVALASALATAQTDLTALVAAAEVYKRATAVTGFMFFMRATDGTAATGKTVTGTISKDTGAFAAIAGAISERGSGWYYHNLTGTEMTADEVALNYTATGCVPTAIKIRTQS